MCNRCPVELHPPAFLAPVWHFIREASSWFLFLCPWPEAQVLWVTMHNESVCVCEEKNWVSWEMKMDFHFLAPVWLIAVKKSPPSRPECRVLDLTITGHALNGSSELMFALDLFLRERWRLRNNSMMPNSSPPKRKRSSKWIRWPWSSSWSGLRHSGKSTCFYVTWEREFLEMCLQRHLLTMSNKGRHQNMGTNMSLKFSVIKKTSNSQKKKSPYKWRHW